MFGLPNEIPALIIVIAGVILFFLAVLMPLFVMRSYFELKSINGFIRRNIANPVEDKRIRELQQQLKKRR